jgi:hypothetical protein
VGSIEQAAKLYDFFKTLFWGCCIASDVDLMCNPTVGDFDLHIFDHSSSVGNIENSDAL